MVSAIFVPEGTEGFGSSPTKTSLAFGGPKVKKTTFFNISKSLWSSLSSISPFTKNSEKWPSQMFSMSSTKNYKPFDVVKTVFSSFGFFSQERRSSTDTKSSSPKLVFFFLFTSNLSGYHCGHPWRQQLKNSKTLDWWELPKFVWSTLWTKRPSTLHGQSLCSRSFVFSLEIIPDLKTLIGWLCSSAYFPSLRSTHSKHEQAWDDVLSRHL